MKKLLYFVVSLLCLSVIFAAGWASATSVSTEPAAAITREKEETPGEPEKEECPDNRQCRPEKPQIHKRGFKLKMPLLEIPDGVKNIPRKDI